MLIDNSDRDGKLYSCELPKAMSEGKWTRSAWECTFQAYAIHSEAVPRPVSARQAQQVDMSDFPFVAPPSGAAGTARVATQAQTVTAVSQSQQSGTSVQGDSVPNRAELEELAIKKMKEICANTAVLSNNWRVSKIVYSGGDSGMATVCLLNELQKDNDTPRTLMFNYFMGHWRFQEGSDVPAGLTA